jgi:hypothetical protein
MRALPSSLKMQAATPVLATWLCNYISFPSPNTIAPQGLAARLPDCGNEWRRLSQGFTAAIKTIKTTTTFQVDAHAQMISLDGHGSSDLAAVFWHMESICRTRNHERRHT